MNKTNSDPAEVLGRWNHSDEDKDDIKPRSTVSLVSRVEEHFCGANHGVVHAAMFESCDDEDRGGVVLSIRIEDDGGSFFPHAEITRRGIEIHMAGDAEADAVVRALSRLLPKWKPKSEYEKHLARENKY